MSAPKTDGASKGVSEKITDAITQTNVKVLAEAPAIAGGSLYQTAAHSTGILHENAVSNQNQQSILAQAGTTQGVTQIYSMDTISDAVGVAKMLSASAQTTPAAG